MVGLQRRADGIDLQPRRPSLGLKVLIPWIVPVLLLVIWQLVMQFGWVSTHTLPTPLSVLQAFGELISTHQLLPAILISTKRALLGFVIGGSIGFCLGLLNGLFPLSEQISNSSLQMLRNIPHLALIPLVILWFGIGETARLSLVVLGVFFPIYLNTFHGIRSVDTGLIEMGRVYGLSRLALIWHIILPGALSSILVGVRYALGIMWLTLIVAETIAANSGIGYLTMNAREFMRIDVMVVGILMYALLGKLADTIARLLERQLLAWHPSYNQA